MIKDLLQEIQLPAYEFTENPVPMDRVEYDEMIGDVIRQTSRFAGLISIYSLHPEVYPGLSKLRLCYVVNDTVDENALRKGLLPSLRKLHNESHIIDAIQIYSQTVFQHIDQLFPISHIKSEYGQDIRFASLTGEDRNFAYLLALNDGLQMSPLNTLLPMLVDGVIAVKPAWLGIEATIDLLRTYQKATGKAPAEWQEFIKKSHDLGRNWFSMNLGRYQDIKQLVREAVVILFTMITEFYNYVLKEKKFFVKEGVPVMPGQSQPTIPVPKEYRASFISEHVRTLFIDEWTTELAFHKMTNLYKKTKGMCTYLPTLLSVPYCMYSKGTELHSALVQKSFLMHGFTGNVAMPGAVDSRNRWISQHLGFIFKYEEMLDYPVWLGYHFEESSRWTKLFENRKKAQHEKWQHSQSLELARI